MQPEVPTIIQSDPELNPPHSWRSKKFLVIAVMVVLAFGGLGVYLQLVSHADTPSTNIYSADTVEQLTTLLRQPSNLNQTDLLAIASQRKTDMLKLAQSSPDEFMTTVLTDDEIAAIPAAVAGQLETHYQGSALFTGTQVVIKGKYYNLDYNHSVPIFINPNTTTTFDGYILDNQFVISPTADGYRSNVVATSNATPPKSARLAAPNVTTQAVKTTVTIPGVPFYSWYDGCAPTSTGMVLGYWDSNGYPNLVPGDASTQTAAVNQLISSHSVHGEAESYEDYDLPIEADGSTTPLPDISSTYARSPHTDNSLADWLGTSRSADGLVYGYTEGGPEGSVMSTYAQSIYPSATPSTTSYVAYTSEDLSTITQVMEQEINAKRPMVFWVDSSGDGISDHDVTVVGYRIMSDGSVQYASHDTWNSTIRWEPLRLLSSKYAWGVFGGVTFDMGKTGQSLPVINTMSASPASVYKTYGTTLRWSVSGTTSVTIDKIGAVTPTGSTVIRPTTTTSYTITATNAAGTTKKTVTVPVLALPKPKIASFKISDKKVVKGTKIQLSWDTKYAQKVAIKSYIGTVAKTDGLSTENTGSITDKPIETVTYTMVATNDSGTDTAKVTVTVEPLPKPKINSFTVSDQKIKKGKTVTLAWSTKYADTVKIDNGIGKVGDSGSVAVKPKKTTTYTITTTNKKGTTKATVTVTVKQPPTVDSFSVSDKKIKKGKTVTLKWSTKDADTVKINQGVGKVGANGSVTVKPKKTTAYTITATNNVDTDTKTVTVTVK